jgi:glycosyltransferase involved in cell wall biosynthesis
MQPSITIITVAYNAIATLESTMNSVFALKYPDIEYIVIDGGSRDGSVELIRKHEKRIHKWLSEPDKGIYDAMNKGLQYASGNWVIFMNCGDRFASPDAIDFFLELSTDADVVYGDALVKYPTFTTKFPTYPIDQCWRVMPFCHQACFVRVDIIKHFRFDLQYRLSSDFDQILRMYVAKKKFLQVDRLISLYDYTDGASIRNMMRSMTERFQSAMSHAYTPMRWLYYRGAIARVYLGNKVKSLLGPKVTAVVTKLYRNRTF